MNCFYLLSLNVPFGFIACAIAMIKGFTAPADCAGNQPGRVNYLKLQIISFFIYIPFCFFHVLVFAFSNRFFRPTETIVDDDKNDTGELKYTSWVQKQHDMEEESEGED